MPTQTRPDPTQTDRATTNPDAVPVGRIESWMHRTPAGVDSWECVLAFPADKLSDAGVA